MRRPVEFWHLPGPRRFVEDVRSRIHAGSLLIVEDPWGAPSTADAIVQRLREAAVFDCLGHETWDGALSRAISVASTYPEKPLAVLIADARLRGSILVVSLRQLGDPQAKELKAFSVARNMLARQDEPPLSLVVVVGKVAVDSLPAGWEKQTTQGIIDPLDSVVFASSELGEDAWLIRRLKTAIAVEVGAWDVELVARLCALSLENAVRPDLCTQLWADDYDVPSSQPSWHAQSVCVWGDEEVIHAAWLAKHQSATLRRRVWAGQLAALLPWIDQFRLQVTETYTRDLGPIVNGEKYRQSLEELDWGPIVYGLKGAERAVPASALKMAESMRIVRNELAHGRPASWASIRAAFELSRAFKIDHQSHAAR
ncbi:hypothetical protein [Rhizobium ruizarguesonis]|uniref:hypothetical protein n=1 Tax=Rhizobium ruizarguesonis TaxID=2081791 RepID=UPI0013DECF25|nr:hypothetical protein [Rhizobium ruizarguesonis]NEJ95409.1 hypothetical protein [Rhizobium ruizarguesonis]